MISKRTNGIQDTSACPVGLRYLTNRLRRATEPAGGLSLFCENGDPQCEIVCVKQAGTECDPILHA